MGEKGSNQRKDTSGVNSDHQKRSSSLTIKTSSNWKKLAWLLLHHGATLTFAIMNSLWSGLIKLTSVFRGSNNTETASDIPGTDGPGTDVPKTTMISRLADSVKEKSKKLIKQSGPLEVYLVPLKNKDISIKGCRSFSFGEESSKPNRTIMVLGATGAGKSTLINGMINYILGVEWEDSYRFVLVDEDQSRSQAHSQTSEVTVYKLYHQEGFQIDYTLTIVDTPGYGDTRGIERDREITEQIRNLFTARQSGVTEIDAVCFVAQASLARLTPSQRYVFDSILSIFGKDVAENIRILVTFADGQKPPALQAINESGVPCPKDEHGSPAHFKFNNSALFADSKSSAAGSDDDENFDHMFWKMGTKSMKRFFAFLNLMETKSLTLTQEVLRERKELEVSVEGLQTQVRLGLSKMEEIRETGKQLKDHEAEISRNEKFEFEVTVMKPCQEKISGQGHTTNCMQCNFTCHYPCAIPDDGYKIHCAAMRHGKCTACPDKCVWTVHKNHQHRWIYKEVKEKRTVEELKEKYKTAKGKKSTVQDLMDTMQAAYKSVQKAVVKLMQKSSKCLNRLKEIALRPNPLSTPEYIDLLIVGEKSEKKPGWKERIESLMKMKEQAEYTARVERGENPLVCSDSGHRQSDPKRMDKKDRKQEPTMKEKGDPKQEPEMKEEGDPKQKPEIKEEGNPKQEPEMKEEGDPKQKPDIKEEGDPKQKPEIKEEGNPKQEPEMKEEGDPKQEPEMKEEGDPKQEPEIKEEGDPKQEPEIKEEGDPTEESESKDEGDPKQEPEMKEEGDPTEESEMKEEGDPKQKPEIKVEGDPKQEPEMKEEGDPKQKPEIKEEGDPKQKPEIKEEGDPKQKPEIKEEGDPKQKPDIKEEGDPKQEPEIKEEGDPKQEPEMKEEGDPKQEPEMKDEGDPKQKPDIKEEGNPKQKPEIKEEGDPTEESEMKEEGNPKQEPEMKEEGDPKQKPEMKEEGDPKQEPEIKEEGNPKQKPEMKEEGDPKQEPEIKEEGNPKQKPEIKEEGDPTEESEMKEEGDPKQEPEIKVEGDPITRKEEVNTD